MQGNRDTWKELLPIIQAFVDGKKIQKLDYDNRWKDTEDLHSLLGSKKHRLKPDNIVGGTWSIKFRQVDATNGIRISGTMFWVGTNMDSPPWPKASNFLQYESESVFTPDSIVKERIIDPIRSNY